MRGTLRSILFIAILGILCNFDDFDDLHDRDAHCDEHDEQQQPVFKFGEKADDLAPKDGVPDFHARKVFRPYGIWIDGRPLFHALCAEINALFVVTDLHDFVNDALPFQHSAKADKDRVLPYLNAFDARALDDDEFAYANLGRHGIGEYDDERAPEKFHRFIFALCVQRNEKNIQRKQKDYSRKSKTYG